MATLSSPRQERFVHLIKQGVPVFTAYTKAGFKQHRGNCYRLRDSERVKRRLAELTRHIAVKTRVTVESLLQDLADDRALAREIGQPSAAIAATQLSAKLVGLLVDRKESGAPGDFASLQTPEAVLDAVRKDLGDAAADVVARLLSQATPADVLPGSARTATEALDTTRDPSEPLN